jgi:hypothetical protein
VKRQSSWLEKIYLISLSWCWKRCFYNYVLNVQISIWFIFVIHMTCFPVSYWHDYTNTDIYYSSDRLCQTINMCNDRIFSPIRKLMMKFNLQYSSINFEIQAELHVFILGLVDSFRYHIKSTRITYQKLHHQVILCLESFVIHVILYSNFNLKSLSQPVQLILMFYLSKKSSTQCRYLIIGKKFMPANIRKKHHLRNEFMYV